MRGWVDTAVGGNGDGKEGTKGVMKGLGDEAREDFHGN